MSDTQIIYSRDPVVRVEETTLWRIVDVDGLGMRRALSFDRTVTWLRESHSRSVLVNASDRVLKEGSTNCDVGYLLQSFCYARDTAMAMAEENDVGSGPFATQVLVDVVDRPVLPLPREAWDRDSSPGRWRYTPNDWFTTEDPSALEAWIAAGTPHDCAARPVTHRLQSVKVLDGHVAWDSRWDDARREAGIAGLMGKALAGLPVGEVERVASRMRAEPSETEDA